jgi:molecular chaperone IbpA
MTFTFQKDEMIHPAKSFEKFFIGFDEHFNKLARLQTELSKTSQSYPPFNIKKIGDNTYTIEMAVAGFSKSDIDIEFSEDKLTVKGEIKDDATQTWLHKGIANRNFTRTFALNEHVVVMGADLQNGMLLINLERILPENKKPRKIEIGALHQEEEPSTVSEFSVSNPPVLLEEDIEQISENTK